MQRSEPVSCLQSDCDEALGNSSQQPWNLGGVCGDHAWPSGLLFATCPCSDIVHTWTSTVVDDTVAFGPVCVCIVFGYSGPLGTMVSVYFYFLCVLINHLSFELPGFYSVSLVVRLCRRCCCC